MRAQRAVKVTLTFHAPPVHSHVFLNLNAYQRDKCVIIFDHVKMGKLKKRVLKLF